MGRMVLQVQASVLYSEPLPLQGAGITVRIALNPVQICQRGESQLKWVLEVIHNGNRYSEVV